MREPLVPTLDRLPESVRRFELPTPFPVGPVNCYLLLDDPVTVVDPGMLYADSVATLTAELSIKTMLEPRMVAISTARPTSRGQGMARSGAAVAMTISSHGAFIVAVMR